MFNPALFTTQPFHMTINLYGPQGRGDASEQFFNEWKMKQVGKMEVVVVGKKDGSPGCFSIMKTVDDKYDISFYEEETPKEVFDNLKNGVVMDAFYKESDPKNKYLYLDLLQILEEHKE